VLKGEVNHTSPLVFCSGSFGSERLKRVCAGTITTGTRLAPEVSINVQFLLGVQQTGTFRFFIILEALA
jgi:hypothetical protein